jgi:cell pole-organizing protein PopZ
MGDMSAEPSMEEILSSIKRIIAEEGEGPSRPARRAPRPAPAPIAAVAHDPDEDAEVLELSDPMPPVSAAPARAAAPAAAPPLSAEPESVESDPVLETPVMATTSFEHNAMSRTPAPAAAPEPAAAEPIVSAHAAEASRSALDNLSRLVVRADAPAGDDNSLEGLVRSMLRPMLREWLDANLPRMVEEMVASEIARITGQTR